MPFFSYLLETLNKNTFLTFFHHLLISFLVKTWYIEIQESNKFSLKCHIFWHISHWIFDIILSRGAPGINSNYSVLKLPLWNINRQTRVVYYCHIPRKRPVWFITYKKKYYLWKIEFRSTQFLLIMGKQMTTYFIITENKDISTYIKRNML